MPTQDEGQHCARCPPSHPDCYLSRWCNACQCFMCDDCWAECNTKGRLHGSAGKRPLQKTEHRPAGDTA